MANIKISELEELTTVADDDILPIVDVSENETKKISFNNLNILQYVIVEETTNNLNLESEETQNEEM